MSYYFSDGKGTHIFYQFNEYYDSKPDKTASDDINIDHQEVASSSTIGDDVEKE